MDLSVAFHIFNYGLFLAKLGAYGFDKEFLNFKVLYLIPKNKSKQKLQLME